MAATKSVESALALLNSGFDEYLLIFFQLSRNRQQVIPGLSLELFSDTADLRQKNEVLFSQPILDSALDFSQALLPVGVSQTQRAES